MRRAKPNAGLVESLSNLRKVFAEIMLGELKVDFTLMRLFGGAHDQAIVIVRLLILLLAAFAIEEVRPAILAPSYGSRTHRRVRRLEIKGVRM
jgi:hypothetical protein